MPARPLILVTPDVVPKGREFADFSSSLSTRYTEALLAAGAIPMIFPVTTSKPALAECVSRADGVMLTGGDDINPKLYGNGLAPKVRKTIGVTPDGGARDFRELLVIDEIFRQKKPLLAICRGHQMLNIALGGDLVPDIPSMLPQAIQHRRMDRRNDKMHDVCLTPRSLLAKITGKQKLAVNSTHHQAIGRLAEPLQAVAVSADGVVEGTELKPAAAHWLPFLLSVQFHPERLADRYAEHRAIFLAFTRACAQCQKR